MTGAPLPKKLPESSLPHFRPRGSRVAGAIAHTFRFLAVVPRFNNPDVRGNFSGADSRKRKAFPERRQ